MKEKIIKEFSGCKVIITFKNKGDVNLKERILNLLIDSFNERVSVSEKINIEKIKECCD